MEEPQKKPEPLLISVAEAARRVGISTTMVYNLIQAGQFPHKRIRRRILVPVKALGEWVSKLTCSYDI